MMIFGLINTLILFQKYYTPFPAIVRLVVISVTENTTKPAYITVGFTSKMNIVDEDDSL